MFYAYPARTMLIPSISTRLFGDSIVGRLQGGSLNNFMPIPSLSALGTDNLYDVYNVWDEERGYYNVMTPNVNPYIAVVCPGAETSAYAIYKPTNLPFNGDTVWTAVANNSDLADRIAATISANDPQMPAHLEELVKSDLLPHTGYFSLQKCKVLGHEQMNFFFTKNLGDYSFGVDEEDAFQYPWDTEEFKQEHAQEIEEYNQNINYWENYIPSKAVWHQPYGARLAMVADADPIKSVDPIGAMKLNGDPMVFDLLPNEFNVSFQMSAYFFYPLLYVDPDCTGEFVKLDFTDGFPSIDGFGFYGDASTGSSYRLNNEMANGVRTKYFGTPIWKLTFNNVPFDSDIDPTRDYFVAFARDGGVLTQNITNADQARQYYFNRPTIKNDVMFWSEAKEDFLSGYLGRDVRAENFLSCAFTQQRGLDTAHSNRYAFDGLAFRSVAYNAVWKTASCPKRGGGGTATEVIPDDPSYNPRGGTITVGWYDNSIQPITDFYIKDANSFRQQTILDGADMTMGVFQVLEMKKDPNEGTE